MTRPQLPPVAYGDSSARLKLSEATTCAVAVAAVRSDRTSAVTKKKALGQFLSMGLRNEVSAAMATGDGIWCAGKLSGLAGEWGVSGMLAQIALVVGRRRSISGLRVKRLGLFLRRRRDRD